MQQQEKYCRPGHPLLAKGSFFCKWTPRFNVLKASRELSRKSQKNTQLQVGIGPWWSVEGRMWGRRRMLLSYSPLSKMCQETGIVCVPSWISMRQKKKKEKGGADVAVAAWQNPPLRGGGVRWQRRSERAPCQREGMRYHTVEDGGVRRWCHMHTAVLGGHPGLYPCVVQMLAHFLYEPDKFIWHVVINTVKQTLAIEQWWLLVSNLL